MSEIFPGECICINNENIICSDNVWVYEGKILSEILGHVVKEDIGNGKVRISVKSINSIKTPHIDAIVLARVTGITSNLVRAEIIAVDDHILKHTYKNCMLRKEAIRSYLRDQAEPSKCFGLGDIIRAKILNITGSRKEGFTYLLSTAEEKCGVIYALSSENVPLIPISETQMFCIKTKETYSRKVAEVNRDFIDALVG